MPDAEVEVDPEPACGIGAAMAKREKKRVATVEVSILEV